MKRPVSVLICVLVLIGMLFAPCSALVTTAAPPLKADDAQLLWKYVPGTDYLDAPSVPVYFEDKVYVMHHKSIDCLNASTGNVEKTGVMTASPSYAIVPVLCTDDMVYCPLGDGTVQAFARDTLISRWVYTDPLGGQALTDIVTDGTHVFTGFWNDEAEDAAFVCLDAATGTCLWRVTRRGGFYFAPCLVVGDTVLLGGDNGTGGDGDGQLLCLDKATGETLDALTFSGDNRSAIVAYADACYFTTKAGKLYKVRLQDGKLTLDKTVDLPGASTAAPIGYGGKLYLGVQKGSAGAVLTLDADTLQTLQTVPVAGYPQAEMLLVDGASPRLILTCNTPPGALYTLDPAAGSVEVLYTPEKGSRNYCISSVQVMPDGTLLYKNDSGAVFTVGKKQKEASLTLVSAPKKTTYTVGQTLETDGLTLLYTDMDGGEHPVTEGFVCDPTTFSEAGTKTVTVSYEGLIASFDVTVEAVRPVSLKVVSLPTNRTFFYKHSPDFSGLVVSVRYNDGHERTEDDLSKMNIEYPFEMPVRSGTQDFRVSVDGVWTTIGMQVRMSVWQWLIVIFLFGWIWY